MHVMWRPLTDHLFILWLFSDGLKLEGAQVLSKCLLHLRVLCTAKFDKHWPGSILYKCKIVKSKHSDSVYMTASQPRPQASRFFKIQNLAYYFEKLGGRPRSEGGIKILGNILPRPPSPEINVCNLLPIRPYTAKQLQHTVTMLHCNEGLNISGCTSHSAKQ